MAEEICINCGTRFQVEAQLLQFRKNDGKQFHCPNGHGMHYSKHHDNEKLIAELKAKVKELEQELVDKDTELRRAKCELLKQSNGKTGILSKLGLT